MEMNRNAYGMSQGKIPETGEAQIKESALTHHAPYFQSAGRKEMNQEAAARDRESKKRERVALAPTRCLFRRKALFALFFWPESLIAFLGPLQALGVLLV